MTKTAQCANHLCSGRIEHVEMTETHTIDGEQVRVNTSYWRHADGVLIGDNFHQAAPVLGTECDGPARSLGTCVCDLFGPGACPVHRWDDEFGDCSRCGFPHTAACDPNA